VACRELPAIKERTAQLYMQLAAGRTTLDAEKRNVADLGLREAVRLLTPPDDSDDAGDTGGDDDEGEGDDDALSDQQKDQILALKQKFGWGPDAIAKALKLPVEDVRRFLDGGGTTTSPEGEGSN
jgi:hypothetical protein